MSIPEGVLVWQSNETSPAPKHPRMSYHVRFPVSHTSSPHITDTYPTLLCTHSRTGPQGASPGSAVTASPGKPSCFALAQGGPTGCLSGIVFHGNAKVFDKSFRTAFSRSKTRGLKKLWSRSNSALFPYSTLFSKVSKGLLVCSHVGTGISTKFESGTVCLCVDTTEIF